MQKKKNTSPEEEKMHTIFAIIFKEEMEVFVNSTAEKNLWKTYDGHYRGRFASTKARFQRSIEQGYKPEFYELDTYWGLKSDGLSCRIAWSKLLSEAGYKLVLEEKMRPMIDDFLPETEKEYQRIKQSSLSELLSSEKNAAEKYHTTKQETDKKEKKHNDIYRIDVKADEKTYRFIKEKAAKYGVSMNELMLISVQSGDKIVLDTSILEKILNRMNELTVMLQGIFTNILLAGKYKSRHIKELRMAIEEIKSNDDELKKEVIQLCKRLKKQ